MSSLPSRFRDSLREVRVGRDQDIGRLPKLLTSSIRRSHEQSCGCTHPSRRKVRPDINAARAAALANETRLQVGQPDAIGSSIDVGRCHRFQMAAAIIRAIDQQPANAGLPHLTKVIFCCRIRHDPADLRSGEAASGATLTLVSRA